MSRLAGPCLPPTADILPSAMATSPEKAALPVPSTILPPRMTMSCMPTSPLQVAAFAAAQSFISLGQLWPDNRAQGQWLRRIPPLQKHDAGFRDARRRVAASGAIAIFYRYGSCGQKIFYNGSGA